MDNHYSNEETWAAQVSLAKMVNYNRWIYDNIKPYLKGSIIDIGSATGNITVFFSEFNKITATDINPSHVKDLEKLRPVFKDIEILQLDITQSKEILPLAARYETVTNINVLEHIKDDGKAFDNCIDLLKNDGRLILLVPAHRFLYNSLDRTSDHFRRYSKQDIAKLAKDNGKCEIDKIFFMNMPGVLLWIVNGHILKKSNQAQIDSLAASTKFNTIVSALEKFENLFPNKLLGLSMIAVIRKK
jgi:SAM-dependent methyltransferase